MLKQHDALKPENIPLPVSVPASPDGAILSTSPKPGSSGTGDSSGELKQGGSVSDVSTIMPIHTEPVSESSTITPIRVPWSEPLSPDTSSFVTAPDTPATGSLIDISSGLVSAENPLLPQLETLKVNDFATSKVTDGETAKIEIPIGEIVTNQLAKDELDNREIVHGIKERDLERDWIWTWLKASESKLQHENQKRSLSVEDSISGAWLSAPAPYLESQSAAVVLGSLGLVALVLAIWGMWLQRRRRNRAWHVVSSV
ncbi:hypothetical protein EX30DRAFT_254524 [Ascodesmis nigricans]|uniref:Uncharacterized protein n=1 Tax=Ascodesmis nigricans TaxID=341454 RepID=A0A4S2MYS8_9PEZI|nr:hypothetical protein EX30DRAFT_254524 [Ascodesmis nigricans]